MFTTLSSYVQPVVQETLSEFPKKSNAKIKSLSLSVLTSESMVAYDELTLLRPNVIQNVHSETKIRGCCVFELTFLRNACFSQNDIFTR